MITIELDWPASCLWQNSSNGEHWAKSSSERAAARVEGKYRTMEAMPPGIVYCAALRITFHAPTNRRYDISNGLGALKSQLDGVADALHIDDSTFSPITIVRGAVRKPGCVTVEIDTV